MIRLILHVSESSRFIDTQVISGPGISYTINTLKNRIRRESAATDRNAHIPTVFNVLELVWSLTFSLLRAMQSRIMMPAMRVSLSSTSGFGLRQNRPEISFLIPRHNRLSKTRTYSLLMACTAVLPS